MSWERNPLNTCQGYGILKKEREHEYYDKKNKRPSI